jgi:hypothetical protein
MKRSKFIESQVCDIGEQIPGKTFTNIVSYEL